jgi:hypothetical protein
MSGISRKLLATAQAALPSFVGATSTSGASSLSLTGITGLQENDLVLFIASDDDFSISVSSGGWTTAIANTNNGIRNLVAYKVMGATPDSSITINGTRDALSAVAFRNVSYGSLDGFETVSNNYVINPPSVTITEDNSVVVLCAFIDDRPTTINFTSTGYTLATENGRSGGSNALMYKTEVASGTEDPDNYRWNNFDDLLNRTVILNPL